MAIEANQAYTWEGVDSTGSRIRGEMQGSTPAVVYAALSQQNIRPLSVRRKSKPLLVLKKGGKIKTEDISYFIRYLATMLSAGLPLVKALDICQANEKANMRSIIQSITADVAGGQALSVALQKHKKHFDDLVISLIKASEESGTLDNMLNRVAEYLEKAEALKKKIKKAMVYPSAVLMMAGLVSVVLLAFVVPQFESLFHSFDAELPLVTRMVVNLSDWLLAYWWIILGAGLVSYLFWRSLKTHSVGFNRFLDKVKLRLPIFGKLLRKAIVARTTRTLATTLAAIPIVEALQTTAETAGNSVYQQALLQVREGVATGVQLYSALQNTHLFSNMVVQMVAVGEESGSLEDMLNKVASFYEAEVDHMVSNLSSLLEPFIMLILGIVIGGFVLAMYMPIFKIGSIF